MQTAFFFMPDSSKCWIWHLLAQPNSVLLFIKTAEAVSTKDLCVHTHLPLEICAQSFQNLSFRAVLKIFLFLQPFAQWPLFSSTISVFSKIKKGVNIDIQMQYIQCKYSMLHHMSQIKASIYKGECLRQRGERHDCSECFSQPHLGSLLHLYCKTILNSNSDGA